MQLSELIKIYRKKLEEDPNDISCLLFVLQIPSICSRIEFPQTPENTGKYEDGKFYRSNGNVWDKNMYIAWLRKHYFDFEDIHGNSIENAYGNFIKINAFCNNLYELRNQITHEGILINNKNKFYFIDKPYHVMSFNNIIFVSIKQLCEDMFDAVSNISSNQNINITPFSDMSISLDIYNKIQNDIYSLMNSFWNEKDKRSEEDRKLYIIYEHMKDDMEEYFIKNSNRFYGYRNKYKNEIFITKEQYERMKQIEKELKEFKEEHQFDIEKYIEEK